MSRPGQLHYHCGWKLPDTQTWREAGHEDCVCKTYVIQTGQGAQISAITTRLWACLGSRYIREA